MSKENKVPTSIRLDEWTKTALAVLCERTHRKQSDMVRHLVAEEVARLGYGATVDAAVSEDKG